ncbi:MAG: DUF2834 domain-containing protein [Acidobacteriota bacterium]|nr:DUF2834 domain-containing protein [Acidobacteriota bacterium]
MKRVYLALVVAGTLLPYSQFVPFVIAHGLDVRLFFAQLFANRISAFFALDVIVASVVLWIFAVAEGRRCGVRHLWLPIAASLLVGVSCALPLFLWMRENKKSPGLAAGAFALMREAED